MKKIWVTGDKITKEELNRLEDKIYIDSQRVDDVEQEIADAKGKKATLKEELVDLENRMVENVAKQYLEVNSTTGNTKVENCYNGKTKDINLKGRTTYIQTCKSASADGGSLKIEGDVIDGKTKEIAIKGRTTYIQTCKPATTKTGSLKIEGDIVDGKTKEIVLKGKTLHNLIQKYPDNRETVINYAADKMWPQASFNVSTELLKKNTHYSAIYLGDSGDGVNFLVRDGSNGNNLTPYSSKRIIEFTTPNEPMTRLVFYTAPTTNIQGLPSKAGTLKLNASDLLILEGHKEEYGNIKHSFEGIQSLGEEENKISILSTGKNLFSNWDTNIYIRKGRYFISSDETEGATRFELYTRRDTDISVPGMYWRGDHYLLAGDKTKLSHVLTVNNDCFINFKAKNGATELIKYINFQLEEGTAATPHQPYQQDKKDILLPVSNGCKGLINFSDAQHENGDYLQKVDTITLNGSEAYVNMTNQNNDTTLYFVTRVIDSKVKYPHTNKPISNTLCNAVIWNTTNEGFNIEGGATIDAALRFRILKSKLQTPDVEGFKKWLQQNPVTVYYELETPILHKATVPTNNNLTTFKDITHISCLNKIEPSGMDVYYPIKEAETDTWTKHNRIESVGDTEENKIGISSCGKNLWKIKEDITIDCFRSMSYKIKKGTYYISYIGSGYSNGEKVCFAFRSGDRTVLAVEPQSYKPSFTLDVDCDSLYIYTNGHDYVGSKDKVVTLKNIQLEEGSTATSYEPYKGDSKEIILPVQNGLKSLPSGVCDEVFSNGDYLQRVGSIFIDGENIKVVKMLGFQVPLFRYAVNNIKNTVYNDMLSEKLINRAPNLEDDTHYCLYSYDGDIRMQLPSYVAKVGDEVEANLWFKSNPTTIYYELATPILHKATELTDNNLTAFKGLTNFSCTNKTTPKNVEVYYPIAEVESNTWTKHNRIESVGDIEENKVNILSLDGFNLLDASLGKDVGGLTVTGELATTGEFVPMDSTYKHFTPVEFEKTYTYIAQGTNGAGNYIPVWGEVSGFDENHKFIKRIIRTSVTPKVFTIDDNKIKYIRVGARTNVKIAIIEGVKDNGPLLLDNIWYKYNKNTDEREILLPVENGFKSLPNGVCDEILENGDYLQRVDKIIIDSNTEITQSDNTSYSSEFLRFNFRKSNIKQGFNTYDDNLICNIFPVMKHTESLSNKKSIRIHGTENTIMLYVNKTELETPDVAGFKKWLQQNPTTVYYELVTPILHKAITPVNLNLASYKGDTHFSCTNKRAPKNMIAKFPIDTVATISDLRLENESMKDTVLDLKLKYSALEEMVSKLIKE